MEQETKYTDANKQTVDRVISDFKFAVNVWNKWVKEAKKDTETCLGDMTDEETERTLNERGIKQLTINKIKPNVKLLSGIEAQNRTDFAVLPEGKEDEIKAEIATRLLKNIVKRSDADRKMTDAFKVKLMTGVSYLEPYIDYTEDLINGDMKIKLLSPFCVYVDPAAIENDLSDARFVIKFTSGISKDELKQMYPEKSDIIDRCQNGTLSLINEGLISDADRENRKDDYTKDSTNNLFQDEYKRQDLCDLVEYHYKKSVEKYYTVDLNTTIISEFESKEAAEKFKVELLKKKYINGLADSFDIQSLEYKYALSEVDSIDFTKTSDDTIKIVKRYVSEIWTAVILGSDTLVQDTRCWCYPKWKKYPIIPDYSYKVSINLAKNKQHLAIQGIVRDIRDANFELNKRRTQELHILNTSANSGWLMEEGSVPDVGIYSKFGASPGVVLQYKSGRQRPQKIEPTRLSQGHSQLAAETSQDIKDISGINSDLLSMNESQASGRAIALRQKQGMVMVQEIFDNFSFSKQILGRFLLSQLYEVYDLTEAKKVLGQSFIEENFTIQQANGTATIDYDGLNKTIEEILKGDELQKYDVSLGENPQSETVKIANYLSLLELLKNNIPIPQDVLIDETMLSKATKEKIKMAMQQQKNI